MGQISKRKNNFAIWMRHVHVMIGLVAMIVSSCEPGEEFVSKTKGAEFFPLISGSYSVYDVDSVAIVSNMQTLYKYQLRLEIKGEFENATGNKSFVIQRLKRSDPSVPWTIINTWSAWTDSRSAVSVEGNQRFVRLRFPIQTGNKWDGNELNNNGGDDDCGGKACDRYEVTETDPDVIVVQNEVTDVLVRFDVRKEVYRKDVGLVYKEITVLDYCTTASCFGKQFVDNGVKYKQTLIEHGQI